MYRDRLVGYAMGAACALFLALATWVIQSSRPPAEVRGAFPYANGTPTRGATAPPTPTDAAPTSVPYPYPIPTSPGWGLPSPVYPYPYPTAAPSATMPVPSVTGTPPRTGTPTVTRPTRTPAPPGNNYLPLITRGRQMVTLTPTATASPTVTPTPTRPWPEALAEPGPSKLGLHIQWNNSPDILEFIRRYKPPVVKGVGDVSYMSKVKEVSPTTVTVGRPFGGDPTMDEDPIQAARDYVARHLDYYRSNPGVDYWEGINEPNTREHIDWLATFEAERARLMARHGLRVAVGSFATGTPEWEEFARFLPAIEAAHRHGGILTVHEYDAPTMERSVGMALPGQSARGDRGTLLLRYRWWYEDYLIPRGIAVPLVISEAGIDGGVTNRPGPRGLGWLDFSTYWAEHGLGGDNVKTYIDQLAWYDRQLRRDDYVVGCTIFTAGAMDDDWRSFDVTHILRDLGAYLVAEARAHR